MARRPLPRILSNGSAPHRPEPGMARTAADEGHRRTPSADHDHPGPAPAGRPGGTSGPPPPRTGADPRCSWSAACVLVVALIPYGPLLALIALMAAAAWKGRDRRPPAPTGPDEAQVERLSALYEALVPYFSVPEDPSPLFAHGGEWEKAFSEYDFDDDGRVSPGSWCATRRTSPTARPTPAPVSSSCCTPSRAGAASTTSSGTRRATSSTVTVLPPLPTDIAAQRFVTAPGETVLGFTDASAVQRTVPGR